MNADIPTLKCHVRLHHISNRVGTEEAYAFGIQSIKARALGFHVMLQSGAHYRNVPIHALTTNANSVPRTLQQCELWDCFSNKPVVHVFDYLVAHQGICHMRGSSERGTYLFTVDWLPDSLTHTGFTRIPDQNKCAHVMELDSGNLCALPTNRIAWCDGYFIGDDPAPHLQGYTVQSTVYQSEDCSFDVSKVDEYCYREEPCLKDAHGAKSF